MSPSGRAQSVVWRSMLRRPQRSRVQRLAGACQCLPWKLRLTDPVRRSRSPPVRQPVATGDRWPPSTLLSNTWLSRGLFRELISVSRSKIVDKSWIAVISIIPVSGFSSVSRLETWRIPVPRIRDRLKRIERCSPNSPPRGDVQGSSFALPTAASEGPNANSPN